MSRMTRIVLVLLLGLGASALLSLAVYRYALRPAQAREDAFAALESGEIKAGPQGVTQLPPQWEMASVDGKVYVTGSRQGTLWALFPKERGQGAKLRGYLFSNKPVHITPSVTASAEVELDFPVPAGPGGRPPARSQITVKVIRVAGLASYEVVNDAP